MSMTRRTTLSVLVLLSAVVTVQSSAATPATLDECGAMQGYKHDIPFWPDNHIHGVGTPSTGDWEWEEDTIWKMSGNTNWHSTFEDDRASSHHSGEERCGGIS
jgi:hypothetical protein